MKKIILPIIVLVLFFVPLVYAEDFSRAESLIQSKVSCKGLLQEDLEDIGDYYMEQMHPGKLHEIMDQRLGGEGSEALRNVHIALAKSFYCGDQSMLSSGMMSSILGRSYGLRNSNSTSSNLGGFNMMGYNNYSYGMMGGYGFFWMSVLWILWLALAAFIFGAIFWWTYRLIIKENKEKESKRR